MTVSLSNDVNSVLVEAQRCLVSNELPEMRTAVRIATHLASLQLA